MPQFHEGIRRAPDRGYSLTSAQTELALKNALRYIPEHLHEKLAPEFMEELMTRGRIYGYRFRPEGKLSGKSIDEYKGNCIEGKAFQVMIDNNLDFDVALYPYELVTYGETGQVCQNWMQYRLIKKHLENMTDEQTLVVESGHPLGLFRSSKTAPRVINTNGLMVGMFDNQEDFHLATQLGVANYGQMTAGGWMYIGPQGIVHGTFNTLINAGRLKLGVAEDGDLKGKIFVTSGLGGMSGAQPKAIEIAKDSKTFTELTEEVKAENYIYFDNQTAYEVYKVTLAYDLPEIESWEIFVDVYSGNIIASESLIREAGPVTGTGTAVNGNTRKLNLYQNTATSYQLKDTTKPMTGTINTYTANYRNTTTGTLMTSPSTTVSDPAAVSAHSYAEVVYDFYKNLFNRNSLDNRGMSIDSIVHYGRNYNNAFWNGYKMIYGDGDGSYFTFLSGDLDVVAHEMTHGVTSNSADLVYEYQPGALNESMSDVLGVLVQTYDKYNVANGGQWTFNSADWVVGDEIYTPGVAGDALRSLANPTLYDQPAHMNNYQNLPNTQNGDWGGVHINSGIPNKAAYSLAQNIGCEKTARIYYRALTVYFNSTTNFSQARLGLIQAATDLYGTNSTEAQAISNAFASVGILGN